MPSNYNMQILTTYTNALLHRTEIRAVLTSKGNSGLADAGAQIASHFKTDVASVVIVKLAGQYGTHESTVDARVYASPEHRLRIEQKPKPKKEQAS